MKFTTFTLLVKGSLFQGKMEEKVPLTRRKERNMYTCLKDEQAGVAQSVYYLTTDWMSWDLIL
jgi:hypothetical protein